MRWPWRKREVSIVVPDGLAVTIHRRPDGVIFVSVKKAPPDHPPDPND